jgi:hypothetical protein
MEPRFRPVARDRALVDLPRWFWLLLALPIVAFIPMAAQEKKELTQLLERAFPGHQLIDITPAKKQVVKRESFQQQARQTAVAVLRDLPREQQSIKTSDLHRAVVERLQSEGKTVKVDMNTKNPCSISIGDSGQDVHISEAERRALSRVLQALKLEGWEREGYRFVRDESLQKAAIGQLMMHHLENPPEQ